MKVYSFLAAAFLTLVMIACSGNKEQKSTGPADDAEFYATQPVKSGQYRAVRYDIGGDNARKGMFDGRILMALSPEQSALLVFENGNRAKVNYKVIMSKPFEKGDSGVYSTVDTNNLPVTISTDSLYVLTFEKNNHPVSITFEKDAMNTGSAVEIMERITEQLKKNK